MFKKTVIESFLTYGCLALTGLLILDQFTALSNFPGFLLEYSNYLRSYSLIGMEEISALKIFKALLVYLIPLLLIVTSLLNLLFVYLRHKKNNEEQSEKSTEEPHYLLPKNGKERFWISIICLNAGFSEELFFRLLLPLLFFNLFDSTIIAILIPSIWFGLAHSYQGINGIISTFIAGLMLFYIFILTQSIWITILVHIFLDLNGLVITPLFQSFLEQKRNSRLA